MLHDTADIFLPAGSVLFYELPVDNVIVFLDQDMGKRVQKTDIAVEDRDVYGVVRVDILVAHGRAGAAGVHHDGRDILFLFVVRRAPEDNRVRFTGVVAEMHDHVAEFDVLVGQRRRIGPQGCKIARYRRGHAHPGIRFNGIGTKNALHEQVFKILAFHRQLARAVQRYGISRIFLCIICDLVRHHFRCLYIRHAHEVFLVERTFGTAYIVQVSMTGFTPFLPDVLAHVGVAFHAIDIHGFRSRQSLDALQAVVCRVVLVRPHGNDLAVLCLYDRAATNAAIRALRQGSAARGAAGGSGRRFQFRVVAYKQTRARR